MNALAESPVHWDPYNPKYFADPYPVFRRMREEAPLYYNEEHDFYAVSRYEDVERVLADRDTFISRMPPRPEMKVSRSASTRSTSS